MGKDSLPSSSLEGSATPTLHLPILHSKIRSGFNVVRSQTKHLPLSANASLKRWLVFFLTRLQKQFPSSQWMEAQGQQGWGCCPKGAVGLVTPPQCCSG